MTFTTCTGPSPAIAMTAACKSAAATCQHTSIRVRARTARAPGRAHAANHAYASSNAPISFAAVSDTNVPDIISTLARHSAHQRHDDRQPRIGEQPRVVAVVRERRAPADERRGDGQRRGHQQVVRNVSPGQLLVRKHQVGAHALDASQHRPH